MNLWHNEYRLIVACFCVCLHLTGCETTRNNHKMIPAVVKSVALQPLFSRCVPGDGAAQFSLEGGGRRISGIDIVWNFQSERDWDIQFNNPLGESQVEISQKKDGLFLTGIDNLSISRDRDGFITIEKEKLPIRDYELSCLLSGLWPVTWLEFMSEGGSGNGLRLFGRDEEREISLDAAVESNAKTINSCSVIQWGGILGFFKKRSKICIRRVPGLAYKVDLSGPSNYELKWWTDNESNN